MPYVLRNIVVMIINTPEHKRAPMASFRFHGNCNFQRSGIGIHKSKISVLFLKTYDRNVKISSSPSPNKFSLVARYLHEVKEAHEPIVEHRCTTVFGSLSRVLHDIPYLVNRETPKCILQ